MVQGDYQWFIWSKVLKHLRLKGGARFRCSRYINKIGLVFEWPLSTHMTSCKWGRGCSD